MRALPGQRSRQVLCDFHLLLPVGRWRLDEVVLQGLKDTPGGDGRQRLHLLKGVLERTKNSRSHMYRPHLLFGLRLLCLLRNVKNRTVRWGCVVNLRERDADSVIVVRAKNRVRRWLNVDFFTSLLSSLTREQFLGGRLGKPVRSLSFPLGRFHKRRDCLKWLAQPAPCNLEKPTSLCPYIRVVWRLKPFRRNSS